MGIASLEALRGAAARDRIAELAADLLVLTETTFDLVPEGGHVAEGGPDWGYPVRKNRRKVLLWSRWPLSQVENDRIEPAGRHVVATADTPIGPVRIHGVCVPWSHSNVTWGRRDRKAWQEHLQYLEALRVLLNVEKGAHGGQGTPLVVAGDSISGEERGLTEARPAGAWADIRSDTGLTVATDDQVIDKIAVGAGLSAANPVVLAGDDLSDHSAVRCRISPA